MIPPSKQSPSPVTGANRKPGTNYAYVVLGFLLVVAGVYLFALGVKLIGADTPAGASPKMALRGLVYGGIIFGLGAYSIWRGFSAGITKSAAQNDPRPSPAAPARVVDKQTADLARSLRLWHAGLLFTFSILLLYLNYSLDWRSLEALPRYVQVSYVALMVGAFSLQEILIKWARRLDRDPAADIKQRYRLVIWQLAFAVVFIALTVLPFLYVSGYTDRVARLVATWFPKLRRGTVEAIAWATSFATSNLIGILVVNIVASVLHGRLRRFYRSWKKVRRTPARERTPRPTGRPSTADTRGRRSRLTRRSRP
jgi:hypothetical protein